MHNVSSASGILNAEVVSKGLEQTLLIIVLVLFTWIAIRDVVKHVFGPFHGPILSKVFPHSVSARELSHYVREVLNELGLDELALRKLRAGATRRPRPAGIGEDSDALRQLIVLLARYTIQLPSVISYGSRPASVTSRYYINTMEASLNDTDCGTMARLLNYLLNRTDSEIDKPPQPDYFLGSKSGNAVFVTRAAELHSSCCILRKSDGDHSRLKKVTQEGAYDSEIDVANFEGAHGLLVRAGRTRLGVDGILLNCNCSHGLDLLRAFEEFGSVVQAGGVVRAPLHACVLFRPDNNDEGIENFSSHGIRLLRYFDLDEEVKAELFGLKAMIEHSGQDNRRVGKRADEIVAILRKRKLIRIS